MLHRYLHYALYLTSGDGEESEGRGAREGQRRKRPRSEVICIFGISLLNPSALESRSRPRCPEMPRRYGFLLGLREADEARVVADRGMKGF